MARIELHPDNSIRFFISELTRSDTDAALDDTDLSGGVTATVLDQQGTQLEQVTLNYEGGNASIDEDWSGVLASDHSLSKNDIVDVKIVADGGTSLKGTWWRRGVRVTEREVP